MPKTVDDVEFYPGNWRTMKEPSNTRDYAKMAVVLVVGLLVLGALINSV